MTDLIIDETDLSSAQSWVDRAKSPNGHGTHLDFARSDLVQAGFDMNGDPQSGWDAFGIEDVDTLSRTLSLNSAQSWVDRAKSPNGHGTHLDFARSDLVQAGFPENLAVKFIAACDGMPSGLTSLSLNWTILEIENELRAKGLDSNDPESWKNTGIDYNYVQEVKAAGVFAPLDDNTQTFSDPLLPTLVV